MKFNPLAMLSWAVAGSTGYLIYDDLHHTILFATIAASISILVSLFKG